MAETKSGSTGTAGRGSRTPPGKLAKIQGQVTPADVGVLATFPIGLGSSADDHWIAFRANKKRKFQRKTAEVTDHNFYTIMLPMPSSLPTTYAQNYATEGLGISGRLGAQMADQGIMKTLTDTSLEQAMGAMAAMGMKGAGQFIDMGGGALVGMLGKLPGPAKAAVAAAGLGATGGIKQVMKGAMVGAGSAFNPHLAQVYNGPAGMRSHAFQYKLVPKSEEESEKLREIIWAFKFFSAPGRGMGGHFHTYPEQWDIDFRFPKYLFNIGQSVMTNFGVDYHGEGVASYFEKERDQPAPVSVVINMTFTETSITTKENIKREWMTGGR